MSTSWHGNQKCVSLVFLFPNNSRRWKLQYFTKLTFDHRSNEYTKMIVFFVWTSAWLLFVVVFKRATSHVCTWIARFVKKKKKRVSYLLMKVTCFCVNFSCWFHKYTFWWHFWVDWRKKSWNSLILQHNVYQKQTTKRSNI